MRVAEASRLKEDNVAVSASRPQYRADRRHRSGSAEQAGSIHLTIAAWVLVLCVLSFTLALL